MKTSNKILKVDIKSVQLGDLFIVKPGEKLALDGEVVSGSSVDTSSLTGESFFRTVSVGSKVLSGFVNKDSLLTIKATSVYETSTATKIINMLENSDTVKTKTERFITKFSRVYTPVVVFLAVMLLIISVILGGDFDSYLYRSLVFLVTSCPCALVISIPLGYFCGIGRLGLEWLLVKGGCELDKFSNIEILAFDKTGTITEGVFDVVCIKGNGLKEEELLSIVAHAEYYSIHPIAKSIIRKYNKKIDLEKISDFYEIAGRGVKVVYGNDDIIIGNKLLMDDEKIECDNIDSLGVTIYVARNGKYLGYLVIADRIKESASLLISSLRKIGLTKLVMISSDRIENVEKVCGKVGIDEYYGELLPTEKVDRVNILKKKGMVAFVGDGINDVPVLKISDLGISLGNIGSDAAIEASDIVLMQENLKKISDGIIISRRIKNIIKFNIVFAIFAKILVLLLGMLGYTTIWLAVFADVGVTLLAVLNTLRIMIIKFG